MNTITREQLKAEIDNIDSEFIEKVYDFLKSLEQSKHSEKTKLQDALRKTQGIWQNGDGLNYQQKLRAEWDER